MDVGRREQIAGSQTTKAPFGANVGKHNAYRNQPQAASNPECAARSLYAKILSKLANLLKNRVGNVKRRFPVGDLPGSEPESLANRVALRLSQADNVGRFGIKPIAIGRQLARRLRHDEASG